MLSSLLQEVSDKSTIIGLVRSQSHQVLKVFGKRPWRRRDQEEFYRKPGTARRTRDSRRTYKFRDKKGHLSLKVGY